MDFYTIVLIIAVVLLILVLTFLAIKMSTAKYYNQTNVAFPPVMSTCPDYWKVDGSYCIVPDNGKTNTGSIYNNTGNSVLSSVNTYGYDITRNGFDAYDTKWGMSGKSSVCQQKDWAGKYNIIWDGVSNYNNC